MKKHLFVLALMLLPLYALADAVEIDGIYYNLYEKGNIAEVTSNPNHYKGDVVIPEKVTYNDVDYRVTIIGGWAFYDCRSLTSVSIPNSVTSIEIRAFSGCRDLTSMTIPNNVTSIGDLAFENCIKLTSLSISNNLTTIGISAFEDCSSLTSITIPKTVTTIGGSAFSGCSGLTSVTISDITAWCNISFSNVNSNPLFYAHHLYMNGHEVTELTIPNSVTKIGNYAFYYCTGFISIIIPNTVTDIGDSAFAGCSGLTSMSIPNSLTKIGPDAFDGCI